MGMNYFLKVKGNSIKEVENFPRNYYEEITKLENGLVWKNRYYPSEQALRDSDDYCFTLHIGKRSAGWNFGLRIYPTYGIANLDDWKRYMVLPDTSIENEEGEPISYQEMISIITKRSAYGWDHYSSREEYEAAKVKEWNKSYELEQKEGGGFRLYDHPVKTYDDILADKSLGPNACRGARGLFGRGYSPGYPVIHVEGEAYDYIPEEDNYSW